MNRLISSTMVLGAVCAALAAAAAPAGKVLFAQEGAQIVNDKGESRVARRGDVIEAGERLVTPTGGISQVLLPDGSLVGLRPGSDLKLDASLAPDKPVLSLEKGALRVIGADLMDAKKPSALTLQSGVATLKLSGADLETAVVKTTDAIKPAGITEAGSYTRLLLGSGSIATAGLVDSALAPRQVAFVGTLPAAPVVVTTLSANVFGAPLPTTLRTGTTLETGVVSGSLATVETKVLTAPTTTTSTLTTSLTGTLSTTKTISPTVTTLVTTSPLVISSPTVVAVAPVTQTSLAITSLTSPIITKTPTLTTTITKPCTVVVIGGKKVCI